MPVKEEGFKPINRGGMWRRIRCFFGWHDYNLPTMPNVSLPVCRWCGKPSDPPGGSKRARGPHIAVAGFGHRIGGLSGGC